jgi:hypothetical protein
MFPYSVAIRNGFIKVGALGFQLRLVRSRVPLCQSGSQS